MYKKIVLSLIMLFLIIPAVSANDNNKTTITVSGHSEEKVAPDIAKINFAVITELEDVKEAQEKNTKITNNIYNKLLAQNISQEQIKTTEFTVNPQYDYQPNQRPTLRGYQVTNSAVVSISVEQAGNIIKLLTDEGVSRINGIDFEKHNETDIKNRVLQNAVKNAIEKAEAIRSVLNKNTITIKNVTENGVFVQARNKSYVYDKKVMANEVSSPTILADLLKIEADVQVVVEIE